MSLVKMYSKYQVCKMFGCLATLAVLLVFLLAAMPGPAGATNEVGDKTTEIVITVNDNGSITTAGTFTVSDLQSMPQVRNIYSAINNNTDKKFYATEGVLLTGLLAQVSIDTSNIDKFTFTATDKYKRTFTKAYLLDTPRYCYPNLENNLSTDGAIQIQPVLALKSMDFPHYDQVDYGLADDYFSVRLFFGQNEQDLVSDQGYVKWVSQIEVFTKPLDAQPPALAADMTHNAIGQSVDISFIDDPNWRNAITEIDVDGTSIAGKYIVAAGLITIDGSVFDSEKDYYILVKATGYQDACVTQHKGSWPVIFTLDGNAIDQHAYTAADLRAMTATTAQYGAHTCKGVALQDLLTAANINNSDWQAQINMTDAATFPIAPVSVADLLDPANRYLLTYDIDGQPVAVGPDSQTTLRIYWGIGITYKNVTGITIAKAAKYTVTPAVDSDYQISSTNEGIKTMTVNTGASGMKYFTVQTEPVTAHDGLEAVVFAHLRNGAQDNFNITKADFDEVHTAQAGFNVQPGDVIQVYIVDDLTNDVDFNPTILQ